MSYTVGSMFAGIGGTCLGFRQAGAQIVWANEMDKNACVTYRENFGEEYLIEGDITEVGKDTIPQLDILIAGFPCQAFSIAGLKKGFEDERGHVFYQILEVINAQQKKPSVIMLENVRNLVSHDHGKTLTTIIEALESVGYHTKYKIMNSMEYGNVPQNRDRIYIVGFLCEEFSSNFEFPEKVKLTNKLNDVVDRNREFDTSFYYNESSKHYDLLKNSVTNTETTYQLRRTYVRENKSKVSPTLTANMGTGGNNVPLLLDNYGKIRKLTPIEWLELQGFPKDFTIPDNLAKSHIYKQAGNSVTVPVVRRIAENIIRVLDGGKIISEQTQLSFF